MGKTGKAPEEEKPDFGKGNEGELGSTRSQRERAPKKIFSPTDPPVAAARAKKTSSESSPVSSKSSFAKKQNVAKTSRSSSITFGGEEPKSEESSTSASTAPQTTEAKPEVQSKSVNERPIKEEIISDDDDAHAYPSLAERVKRNRESILPKPVVTSPVAAKKRPLTHSSKSDKKLVAPQQHKAKVGPQKVSSLLMSSEKTKKMPSQPNRLPNTGVPQKPGKKETAGNSLEKNKDIEHTDKSKDYEVIQASKVRRSSSLEDKSSKTVKSAKITVPKEVSAKDTVQSSTLQEFAKTKMVGSSTKTGTKLIVTGVARATPVTPKTDVTAKPKEVPKACVSSFPKDQQEAGPSRAYDAPNPVPLVRTTILPQLTEEGKRLRAETQRIQEAGATEMEDRPPILPKVTEEFKKRLYDPYVRSRMREEGSGSEQSSADIETPPPLQQNLDEEHESVEEPQEFPSLVVPSPQQNLNEEHKLAEEPPEIPDVRIPLVVVPSVPRQGSSSKESEGEQSSKQIYNPSLSSSLQLSKPTNRMKGKNAPVRKSSADVTTAELQKNVREEEESNSSKEVESGKDIDPLPEPGRIFRNRAKTTSGPTVPSKNVPTTMSSDFKTSSLDSIPERQRKDNNSESQGADVQSEKPEKAAAAKAATASDIPMEPRLTRRTAIASLKQNESVMPANLEGLRDDASTPFDAEKLPEESEEFLHDSSSDKKKKKKKKKRHSEKHDSEEPPHDNDVQDPSAPETPKGSLKFKISLKGSPTIKASTPCEEMKEQEDELIDVESDVDKKKIQSKSVPPKKVCLQLVSGASKPVANKPKVVPAKVIVNDAPSSSGLPTPSNPTENVFSSIFEKSIKEEAMDYEYIDEKVATSIPDKAVACSKTVESKDSDDVSARTRSSRNAAKILPKKIPELDRDKSTPGSTSPELGDAGLGYSYPRPAAPKNKETVQKLGKKDKPEEEDESEIVPTRTLRPRKPAINAPKKQMIKKPEIEGLQLPYYTGPVKDLKPIWKHEPTLAEERESRTEAMTQAIRNALLSEPMKYVPDELVSEDELYHDNPASLYYYINDSYKWERPALENGKDYDPDDFEDVAAEMPQLRDQKLACLDPDREESFWEIPENREEYYDSNEEKIDRFLKQCQILGIQIDRGLRHLHSHCGHNPQQALETIDRRAKSMVLYKPLTEREQQIFQEVYRAYGKNFRKIAYFCNLPVKKVVQHYYKSKKTYCYKKLMLQNPCRVNGRISEGKFPGTCFFCKRKARTLKADRRFEGDEHPRLICMTCRTNRKTVNGHLEKWSQIFQGDRIQELDLPILSERLTEKDRYREERGFCIAQMYLANSGEESAFDIQYPTDFNFLFHDELKPTFEDFAKIAAREQQRLKNLGLKVSKNDEQFDPKEDFCMNLKEFYKDPTPQPSVQEQLPEMREKLKLTINKCKTIWNEILELEGDSSEEDERDDKMDDIVSQFRKMKKPSKVATTELFTETDYRYTMQAFVRYGVDFPSAALIVKNKTPAAIEEFYKENKANFDKFLEPYHGQRAIEEYKEKMKREDPKQAEYYDKCEFKTTDPDPTEPSATKL